jgi:aminoglycoside phosphotransferase (APT) family kinase protein
MERLSGEPMLNRVARNPLRAWGYFERMAALHAELHQLDPAGWPLPAEGPLAERMLAAVRTDAARFEFHDLDSGIAWLEEHKGAVMPEERSICHGDFHPLNILVDGDGRFSVVDWGGADTGDRHADVANTMIELTLIPTTSLSFAQRAIAAVARRISARRYIDRYRAHLPLDAGRLRYWEALLALRWAFQFSLMVRDGSAAYGQKPETTAYVRQSHIDAFRRHFEKLTRA